MSNSDVATELRGNPEKVDVDPKLLCLTQLFLSDRRNGVVASPESIRAWETFYSTYLPIIRDHIRRLGLREPDLSDCVQEVWRKLILQLSTFEHDPGRCRFQTWLQVLIRNQSIDLMRRRRRWSFLPLDGVAPTELVARPSSPSATPKEQALVDEVQRALQDLSRSISPQTYQVLVMRWLNDRSVAETAAALGLSHQQVWARYHRAKKRLIRFIDQRRRQGAPAFTNVCNRQRNNFSLGAQV